MSQANIECKFLHSIHAPHGEIECVLVKIRGELVPSRAQPSAAFNSSAFTAQTETGVEP